MQRMLVAMVVAVALLGACSDDDGDDGSSSDAPAGVDDGATDGADDGSGDDGNGRSSGEVVDPAAPGTATVSVDGLDLAFSEVLTSGCSIADDTIFFAFAAEDGVTTLGAGLNRFDDAWTGSIAVDVPNPDGEGVIGYYPAPTDDGTLEGTVAVDGSSMSYSGPMVQQPVNDGTNPPPVDVGDGTISATCS